LVTPSFGDQGVENLQQGGQVGGLGGSDSKSGERQNKPKKRSDNLRGRCNSVGRPGTRKK